MDWAKLVLAVLALVDKIWSAFSKTPSKKIANKTAELRERIEKFKKGPKK